MAGDGDTWRIPLVRPSLPPLDAYCRSLEPVWQSRMLSNFAAEAQRLEAIVAAYTGQDHVLAVSSCDIGLTLAIAALGVPRGAEAIVPSFTFNSTVNAVLWNGLTPRFVDADPESYCLDPAAVEAARTADTAIVVATHVFGTACDVEGLSKVADGAGVPLLFDAAQAIATFVDDFHVSAFGDASVFSLSGTKVVTAGEGGIAVFRSGQAAEAFVHLRSYGFKYDYVSRYAGLNGKMSELHAALGCLTVTSVDEQQAARARLVQRYRELLGGTPVRFQRIEEGVRPSHTYLAVEVPDRDLVIEHLARAGIQAKPYFRPLHHMPFFGAAGGGDLPVTDQLARTVLCLPLYADLSDADVELVCRTVLDSLAGPPASRRRPSVSRRR
ncbi:MAG: DegT/DnrJ/EryC1/StrS family aminotransferase [Nocardioidaceae bacterium]